MTERASTLVQREMSVTGTADADASPEICARRRVFPSPDEVVSGIEADQSHDDQIDRHDEVQQPRHDRDQDAGEEGDERRDEG